MLCIAGAPRRRHAVNAVFLPSVRTTAFEPIGSIRSTRDAVNLVTSRRSRTTSGRRNRRATTPAVSSSESRGSPTKTILNIELRRGQRTLRDCSTSLPRRPKSQAETSAARPCRWFSHLAHFRHRLLRRHYDVQVRSRSPINATDQLASQAPSALALNRRGAFDTEHFVLPPAQPAEPGRSPI